MKKVLSVVLVLIFSLTLAGCLPKLGGDKTSGEMPELSDDDSLETIEKELEETTVEDFEAELDKLDGEIDKL